VPHPDDLSLTETASPQETEPPPVPEAVARPDVYEQIRRLAELRDEGLIMPEEYEVKKRDLLDRL
jgi:hypothetical protein